MNFMFISAGPVGDDTSIVLYLVYFATCILYYKQEVQGRRVDALKCFIMGTKM